MLAGSLNAGFGKSWCGGCDWIYDCELSLYENCDVLGSDFDDCSGDSGFVDSYEQGFVANFGWAIDYFGSRLEN